MAVLSGTITGVRFSRGIVVFLTISISTMILFVMTFYQKGKTTVTPLQEGIHMLQTFPLKLDPNASRNEQYHNAIAFNSSFKDLLPRSAYFDDRPRDGHNNATVILVQASQPARKEHRVVGCGVGKHYTKNFKFKALYIMKWIRITHPHLTHDDAMLTCYDLPAYNGSRAFVFYRDKDDGKHALKLESEKKVFIPSKKVSSTSTRWKSSILVCTTVYGKPPWLREWLVYQKTIGVDFIHVYAQESFITEGGANNSVLHDYLESGYATLDVRKSYLSISQDFYYQQPLLYEDCIYRYRTAFDYVLLYDTDDFFVPVIPGETDIHYYAERMIFHKENIASARFQWFRYFPDCGLTKDPEKIEDGNLTNYLTVYKHVSMNNFKSIHKLSAVTEVHAHKATAMMPHYHKESVPISIAYFAHIRITAKKPDICNQEVT